MKREEIIARAHKTGKSIKVIRDNDYSVTLEFKCALFFYDNGNEETFDYSLTDEEIDEKIRIASLTAGTASNEQCEHEKWLWDNN